MNPVLLKYIATGLAGAVLGGSVTYAFLAKRLERKWQLIADEQIESVKEQFRIVRGEGKYADPENLVDASYAGPIQRGGADFDEDYPTDEAALKELADNLVDAGYMPVSEAIANGASDDDIITLANKSRKLEDALREDAEAAEERPLKKTPAKKDRNVFKDRPRIPEGPDGAPNDPKYPYVISVDDFAVPDDAYSEFATVTVKYYAGDKILLDSKGEIELDVDGMVGLQNLTKFGHLSQDDDVVYVRNERISVVFEIIRVNARYAELAGMQFDPDEDDEPGFIKQRSKSKDKATARFASEG